MKSISSQYITYFKLIVLMIIIKFKLKNCQINDNFQKQILEEGEYEFLDIEDSFNLGLIVSTSKKIYKGMPPEYISTTNASIINTTALLEINENYLLAACLEDCLLAKININTGESTPLLNYRGNNGALNIADNLDIPIIPCSLVKNKEFIFIAYTKIDYYQNSINKTHTIFKFALLNNTIKENPCLNQTFSRKYTIPYPTIKTESLNQIQCQPLKINNNKDYYNIVCIYEDYKYHSELGTMRYFDYAVIINRAFQDLIEIENQKTIQIYTTNITGGIKFYRLNDTFGRFVIREKIFDIYLENIENIEINIQFIILNLI